MPGDYAWKDRIPVAPLKIIALDGCRDFVEKVNDHIVDIRKEVNIPDESLVRTMHYSDYDATSYLVDVSTPRFGTGEGKGVVNGSVRGADLYIICDVTNHSLTYTVNGFPNHMSPDDHYQDLKRIIAATISTAKRVTVIMPFLYESRQHKRSARESLDCAIILEELTSMGVHNVITFDAHDPRVQNAIPLRGFDNYHPTYNFVKTLFKKYKDIVINKDRLMIISPDEGAMDRAVYLANNMGIDMGMFYKRRDYSRVVDGRNPIVAHEFLGTSVENKDVIIIDDMLSSGESMLDTARNLKERKAKRVFIFSTFGLFTNGFDKFDQAYSEGVFDCICTTNLNYRPKEIFDKPWYIEADMSRLLASVINCFNHDAPMSDAMQPHYKIRKLVEKYRKNDDYDYIGKIV